MFWGCVVTESKPFVLPEDSEHELLHISNAALSKSSEPGKTYLLLHKGDEAFTIGSLQKDKVDMLVFDIYVRTSQKVKFTVSGKGEVHITGYFEPTEERDIDDEILGRLEDVEEEEESEDIEEKPAKKKDIIAPAKKEEKKEPKKQEKKMPKKDEKKPEPAKKVEPKQMPIKGKKKEEEESEEEESFEEELDLLGSSEEEGDEELKQIVAEKKHPAEKPLVPGSQTKKAKEEVGGQGSQGEGKKKKKKGGK